MGVKMKVLELLYQYQQADIITIKYNNLERS